MWRCGDHLLTSVGGTVNIMWLGRVIPHSYIPHPLLYHTLYQHWNQCKKWSVGDLCNMGLNSQSNYLRHPHLGTEGDMVWGCPLLRLYCRVRSRSYQSHFKVKPAIILNKNIFLQFSYVFCCKEVFHKAAVDILWPGSLPTRTLGSTVTIWLGGVIPHSYITLPSYITPCTSANISAKWGQLESCRTWASSHKTHEGPTPGL